MVHEVSASVSSLSVAESEVTTDSTNKVELPVTTNTTSQPSTVPKPAWGPRQEVSQSITTPKPVWGSGQQPSAIPKSTVDASAKASTRVERSYSVVPKASQSTRNSSRESRCQSVVSTRRRRYICSVVPDSVVLTPIRRPDNGGTSGTEVLVYTNHFKVDMDNAIINQYDVDILSIDNRGIKRSARKDERWEVVKKIVQENENFPMVW